MAGKSIEHILGWRGPGGDRVLCKEYGCNLQDSFRLIGHAISMSSLFGVIFAQYGLVAQL